MAKSRNLTENADRGNRCTLGVCLATANNRYINKKKRITTSNLSFEV